MARRSKIAGRVGTNTRSASVATWSHRPRRWAGVDHGEVNAILGSGFQDVLQVAGVGFDELRRLRVLSAPPSRGAALRVSVDQ